MKRLVIALTTGCLALAAVAAQAQAHSSAHTSFRMLPTHGCCAGRRLARDGFFSSAGWETPFYSDYTEAPSPPTVVVIREERQPQPVVTPAQPPAAPQVIEIPHTQQPTHQPARQLATAPVPAIFLLTDGRKIEASNYSLTHEALFIHQRAKPATKIPLEQLELEATLTANRQRGINLRIPQNSSELYLGF